MLFHRHGAHLGLRGAIDVCDRDQPGPLEVLRRQKCCVSPKSGGLHMIAVIPLARFCTSGSQEQAAAALGEEGLHHTRGQEPRVAAGSPELPMQLPCVA